MTSMIKKSLVLFFVLVFSAGMAIAADKDQDQTRDRLKDGSCQEDTIESHGQLILAGDQTQDQLREKDQLKDGSCQEDAIESHGHLILSKDCDHDHDHDGAGQG